MAIKARVGRRLVLPPYSPNFNPIESAFAKLKELLTKAAVRTTGDLSRAIGAAMDSFSLRSAPTTSQPPDTMGPERNLL